MSERSDTDEIDVADLDRAAVEAARLVREEERRAEAEELVTALLGRHDPRARPGSGRAKPAEKK